MPTRPTRPDAWALRALVLAAMLAGPAVAIAQEPAEAPRDDQAEATQADPIALIREEGLERSKVMETLSHLSDVIGPRLTASPAMRRANEWTRDTLAEWGCENADLESWGTFGRGWTLKGFHAQVVDPQCIPLIAVPKAWSPGTGGTLSGKVVLFDAERVEDFEKYEGKLDGAIVLISRTREVVAGFEPLASRFTDERLLQMANASPPGEGRRPGRGEAGRRGPDPQALAAARERQEVAARRDRFLMEQGAAMIVDCSSRGDGGTIFVQSATVPPGDEPGSRARPWDPDAPELLPQMTLAVEHYGRLVRMIGQGVEPVMEVRLDVEFHDDDLGGYNTIAEIPGTDPDLKDEVVMIGGHLDSWHGGTGATDNASGCAVAMEAMRILLAQDLKPRRTIRIALWSGEEQGLFGSRNYVAQHFGARNDEGELETTPEFDRFSAYYNLDNGTGKIRGVYLQGNEEVRPIFRRWLEPFADLDASTLTASNTGGTDHLPFDGIGLPGFQFIQDPIEYGSRTHHSNMDVYERLQEDDLKQASVIMAAFAYNTAMMDERLPRKPAPGR